MSQSILLIGARLSENFGGPSLAVSTRMALSRFFPGGQYTLLVPPESIRSDLLVAPTYGFEVAVGDFGRWTMAMAVLNRVSGLLRGPASARRTIKMFRSADVVIDIWGICFADSLGQVSFRRRAVQGMHFVLAKILRRPVVKYTAAIGPFYYTWTRFFARLYFQHFVDLILARGEATKRRLRGLGVRTKIRVCPDTAFVLQPRDSEVSERWAAVRRRHPVVVLSVSHQARNRARHPGAYIRIMAEFVAHLLNHFGARVAILPNELSRGPNDDALVAQEVCDKVGDERAEVLRTGEWSAQQTKGVIGEADAVVAARYHTVVAALSLGIPTLAIGWHDKYAEVLGLFGQEHRLCDIAILTTEDLINKFEGLWNNRASIRNRIIARLPEVNRRINAGAKEVHDLAALAGQHDGLRRPGCHGALGPL